jgi:NAD(P)-dependent dehydrogenase (short-subunit alcohol dehydrogenase family)
MSALEGRVAFVTGASRGVGASVARALSRAGASVVLASRSGSGLGIDGALSAPCDVRDLAALESLVTAAKGRFGGIDIVVANAGVGAYGDFLDLDVDVLHEIIDVNVTGTLHTIRATLPLLLESPAAELVVVASIAGQHGPPGEAVYAASKFAQVGLMRSLDHELWSRGVRCSTVCPGGIATDFAMGRGRSPDDPDLATMMHPDDVAEAVMHVLSRPRTARVLEASLLPMQEDSMG